MITHRFAAPCRRQYADKVLLGFPSNDFQQEDADAKKTADVCFNSY